MSEEAFSRDFHLQGSAVSFDTCGFRRRARTCMTSSRACICGTERSRGLYSAKHHDGVPRVFNPKLISPIDTAVIFLRKKHP
jgi:hypothetical protein